MTTLRQKMKDDMTLFGLAESTQAIYLKAVIQLYKYYQASPATLSSEQVRAYLLHLKNKKRLASNTYNTQIYGLRFFYIVTLRRPAMKLDLPTTKVTYKLPEILSKNEVQRIIQSTHSIPYRTLFMLIYSAGLRVSEALNLKLKDIDSDRMTLHIRHTKRRKERYVILSPVMLKALREYWKVHPFQTYLFPSHKNPNKPLSNNSAYRVLIRAKVDAGVSKRGGLHAFRHGFATHLLETGTDLFTIKALLGHTSIQSTIRYLAFVPHRYQDFISPIDRLTL